MIRFIGIHTNRFIVENITNLLNLHLERQMSVNDHHRTRQLPIVAIRDLWSQGPSTTGQNSPSLWQRLPVLVSHLYHRDFHFFQPAHLPAE